MSYRFPFLSRNHRPLSRWLLPALVLLVLQAATLLAWYWQRSAQTEARELLGIQESAAITAAIRERLHLHALFLRSLQAFALANPGHDLSQWRRFAKEIDIGANLSGLFAFAYAPAVGFADRARPERHGFNIFPETGEQIAAPLLFVAPETPARQSIIGFDQLSEQIRRITIEQAVATRQVAMTGPLVPLTDKASRRPGFLLMHAIFRAGMPLETAEERSLAFAGVVLTAYRTDEFFSALNDATKDKFALRIFDESLTSDQPETQSPTLIHDSAPDQEIKGDWPLLHHQINFGGRNWKLHFHQLDHPAKTRLLNPATLILYGGSAGGALLALLVFYLSTHRERAQQYADLATQELRRHGDQLHELVAERTTRLDHALLQARAASDAKSEFLTNMSHELRTPMHAIQGFSQLGIERANSGDKAKIGQYFQRIEQSATRLLGLINELLDLSKLEAGRMEMMPERTDLVVLLQHARSQLESLLLPRQLRIEIKSLLPDSRIEGDPERLSQVIYNLLANAIKFSPEGGAITVELSSAELPMGRRAQDSGRLPAVAIRFADQGMGIPPDELEHIFDKFVQSSSCQTGASGTGLGLAISRAIVAQHRGTIVASNDAGGGACFTVTLPVDGCSGGVPESND